MILHSVTPIWAMQQMMAEQSEQPTTVLLSETAALQGRIQNARFSAAGAFPGKTGEAAAKKQIFLDYFL